MKTSDSRFRRLSTIFFRIPRRDTIFDTASCSPIIEGNKKPVKASLAIDRGENTMLAASPLAPYVGTNQESIRTHFLPLHGAISQTSISLTNILLHLASMRGSGRTHINNSHPAAKLAPLEKGKIHMCIINNTARIITLIATILYGAVVLDLFGKTKHILGYYNTIKEPSTGGNAMLIAIPVQQTDGEELPVRLIETSDMPNFMTDLKAAVEDDGSMCFSPGASRGISKGIVIKNFDNGLYDVVVAGRANEITDLLKDVDPNKRPDANPELYEELDTVYLEDNGFIFLVFCFDGKGSGKVAGALIEYTPADPTKLFLPALEGHQGKIERGKVRMDHAIVVGTHDMRRGSRVTYTDDSLSEKRPYYLLDRVIGVVQQRGTRQGDFVVDVEDLRNGHFECFRTVPAGWNNLADSTNTEPQRIDSF